MNRKCRTCHKQKPLTSFYKTGRKNGNNLDARHSECKECTKKRVAASYKANPDQSRDSELRRKYGITLADFKQMVIEQDSKCACCGTDKAGGKHNTWNVDHCHKTGKVRDLLCKNCNLILGMVDDDIQHLFQLMNYLVKHNVQTT